MSEEQLAKRSVGRTPNALKKGNTSWTPANVSEVYQKEDGYRYRWSRKDKDNLQKKAQEGWETVSAIEGPKTSAEIGYGRIDDGKPLTSVYERSDSILQRIPEEVAAQRQQYFLRETGRRTQGLTAHVKREMAESGTKSHGSITISSRQGTQVIE